MSLGDYAHWNEEAAIVWWAEEGRFADEDVSWDDDDVPFLTGDDDEHDVLGDCLRDSCFSLPTATGVWECDVCGRTFPAGHPEAHDLDAHEVEALNMTEGVRRTRGHGVNE